MERTLAGLDGTASIPFQSNGADFDFGFTENKLPTPEPADFIQHLASQNQLLACLKWLGEFQILALIPLNGSISVTEIAELASVPDTQLSRVVRITAAAGFLQEPLPCHVAHTPLSTSFVTNLSFLDAVMFLAEHAAPTALHMSTATQRQVLAESSSESAYSIAFNTTQPFQSACSEQPRLQRQYAAYSRHAGVTSDGIDLLWRLNWRSLGSACIVDSNAEGPQFATSLAKIHTSLRFVVQLSDARDDHKSALSAGELNDLKGRVTIQTRLPAAPQIVDDAAVYILRLTDSASLREQISLELHAHFNVLRANSASTLMLALPFLPEPGSVDPDVEASARLWDLSRLQLTNESELELGDLENLINGVQDNRGQLVVINKLRSRSSATMALGIKYQQASVDGFYSVEPLLA